MRLRQSAKTVVEKLKASKRKSALPHRLRRRVNELIPAVNFTVRSCGEFGLLADGIAPKVETPRRRKVRRRVNELIRVVDFIVNFCGGFGAMTEGIAPRVATPRQGTDPRRQLYCEYLWRVRRYGRGLRMKLRVAM
jgi:hypothetical protein